ncbi:DUF3592 domain-containing protein [Alteromonadaceae bacterium M269]|nr:DUF3592 domain-containing protein [Alteromonadaceae bacterium M269]
MTFADMDTEEVVIWGAVLYFACVFIYSIWYSRQISNWPFVIGTLLNAHVEKSNLLEYGRAYEKVSYEYEVEGKTYIGDRLSPLQFRGQVRRIIERQIAKIEFVSSNKVKVYYDKKNPQKSFLVRETWLDIFQLFRNGKQ